jgi:hypothetical protein
MSAIVYSFSFCVPLCRCLELFFSMFFVDCSVFSVWFGLVLFYFLFCSLKRCDFVFVNRYISECVCVCGMVIEGN